MFCAGNNTERMRMGRVSCVNETIVDLYAGIGYFTLPFLVHGHARHVYACEWNPDSLEALHRNLQANHIDDDRYTLLLGDNQVVCLVFFWRLFTIVFLLDMSYWGCRSMQSWSDSIIRSKLASCMPSTSIERWSSSCTRCYELQRRNT